MRIIVGLFAAVTGGVVVWALRRQLRAIIARGAPYALLALIGVLIYVALADVNGELAAFACVGFLAAARFLTLRWGITTSSLDREADTAGPT